MQKVQPFVAADKLCILLQSSECCSRSALCCLPSAESIRWPTLPDFVQRATATCILRLGGASAGVQPISESYCIVIACFVERGDMDTGRAVFNSMQRAGHDARPGWLCFAKAAFAWG